MPGKRSRVGHCQSLGDTDFPDLSRMYPVLRREQIVSGNVNGQSDQRTLTVSSLPRESDKPLDPPREPIVSGNLNGQSGRRALTLFSTSQAFEAQTGHFLERCYYCKKWLAEDKDAYMYGSFTAFCTPECRDAQIAIDEVVQKIGRQSTKRTIG